MTCLFTEEGFITARAQRRELTETFNVTVYGNASVIGAQNVALNPGENQTLTFVWDTTGWTKGNYSIIAVADIVPGETDKADNTYIEGTITVTIPGDFDGSFRVGPADFALLAVSYGSTPWQPGPVGDWNPNCDVDCSNKINSFDFAVLASHYGEHYP